MPIIVSWLKRWCPADTRKSNRHQPVGQHSGEALQIAGIEESFLVQGRERPSAMAVGAENLCHQAIFMNHASGAVAPPGAPDAVSGLGDAEAHGPAPTGSA
jgi:hypothetical protein